MIRISQLRLFLKNIQNSNFELKHHRKKSDDNYAMTILQPLIAGYPYLPFNSSAFRPFCLTYILNEILINKRSKILEFGSGISTILIARLIKKNNLNIRFWTVEHNMEWANIVKQNLENEDLLTYVKIINADLIEIETELGLLSWYDTDVIHRNFEKIKFDFVIIDGPPAHSEKIKYSRFPGLDGIKDYLDNDFCVVLDDADRIGEKEIIKTFLNKNKDIKFSIVGETMAVFRNAPYFEPIPFYY